MGRTGRGWTGTHLTRTVAPDANSGVFRDLLARTVLFRYSRRSIARGDYARVGDPGKPQSHRHPKTGKWEEFKMALARTVVERLKSSDGRIRVKTLSGVSALVAVIALLVGVLPVLATHVDPDPLDEGGGSGKCSVETGDLPSAAGNEFHINNPTPGHHIFEDSEGNKIRIHVEGPTDNRRFLFEVTAGDVVVYDVIVNGGPKSNHYDYDGNGGPVPADEGLHAPSKGQKLHNLSHINICYDEPGKVLLACDEPVTLTEPTGLFQFAEATIFANFVVDECNDKRGSFFIDNGAEPPTVTLGFEGDGTNVVAGRLDVTKEFGAPPFVDLTYDRDGSGSGFVPVPWCGTRGFEQGDGTEFSDWLTTGEGGSYPSLPSGETACKVAEDEDVSGTQFTVVYFEFEDPNFR